MSARLQDHLKHKNLFKRFWVWFLFRPQQWNSSDEGHKRPVDDGGCWLTLSPHPPWLVCSIRHCPPLYTSQPATLHHRTNWHRSQLVPLVSYRQDRVRLHWRCKIRDTHCHLWGPSRVSPWLHPLHTLHQWAQRGAVRRQGGHQRQGRTRRSISTGYLSAALSLCHTSGADRFHFYFSLCVNFQQVRCAACLFCPALAVQSPPEQICRTSIYLAGAEAQRSDSTEFCTEQTGNQASK